MDRRTATVLLVLAMVAIIVAVDVLFFRNKFGERLAVNIGQHCFGYHYVVESADHRPVSLRGHCPLLVDLGILRRLPVRRMCRTILRERSLAHRRSRATVAGIARALHSAHTPLCKPVRYAHPERFIIDVNLDELHQCEGP